MTNAPTKRAPIAKAQLMIRKPVGQVFEAMVDPALTSRFWFSKGSGRLEAGKRVRWEWEMYGVHADVDVKEIEPDRRILVEWSGYEAPTPVEWRFEPKGADRTFVTVENWGFGGEAEKAMASALDSAGGFAFQLAGLKVFLEYGIDPKFVLDHAPDHLVAGWVR